MTIAQARRLFLHGQGLLAEPKGRATPASTLALIESLGFVQLDSINIVERAHHTILWSRLHDYRPAMLDRLQHDGKVFEHWTHDASIIPTRWFPHWHHRFSRVESWSWSKWLHEKLGKKRNKVLSTVLDRIEREGPLMARDFEQDGHKSGAWWDWKPAKTALEYWWRAGKLAIPRRRNFQKVYDLTHRVLPDAHALPIPELDAHIEWACRTAMERLQVATPRELAAFWKCISPAQAASWCKAAAVSGEIAPVSIKHADGEKPAFAWSDWNSRISAAPEVSTEMRLLSPFDPIIRDRARCKRLFGFDYRLEAFVPAAKRKYGYYVLPVLQSDKFVARVDPSLDREAGVLRIRRIWWEQGVRQPKARRKLLDVALNKYAEFAGARRVDVAAAD
jgi:uncharacterized protein YcaQ